jgi:hypothetical protein
MSSPRARSATIAVDGGSALINGVPAVALER